MAAGVFHLPPTPDGQRRVPHGPPPRRHKENKRSAFISTPVFFFVLLFFFMLLLFLLHPRSVFSGRHGDVCQSGGPLWWRFFFFFCVLKKKLSARVLVLFRKYNLHEPDYKWTRSGLQLASGFPTFDFRCFTKVSSRPFNGPPHMQTVKNR